MLITSAPIVIPVNTANVPTEAVAAEAAQRPKIPQPAAASDAARNKNSTEFSDQSRPNLPLANQTEQNAAIQEKDSSQQQPGQEQSTQQNNSEADQQAKTEELESQELIQIQKLRSRDREVRAHEQAHASVGGTLAGAPNLNFTTGPDGKRYAVSGEVSIDIAQVANDPAATIRKLEQVQRAALAPANPSTQDVRVAARAAASENQARSELNLQRIEQTREQQSTNESSGSSSESQTSLSINNNSTQAELANSDTSDIASLASTATELVNPVSARRQAAQLNQRIAGSGALDLVENQSRSFLA